MSADPFPPLLSCADAAEVERSRLGGEESAEWEAMSRAGKAVACAILRDFGELGPFPQDARLLVLVGKGHNGGDALIAAREILDRVKGAKASVLLVFGERPLRPLAARAWRELLRKARSRVERVPLDRLEREGAGWTVAIDGVFGFQFRPPLPAGAAAALQRVNALPVRFRAAVDLPSGLDEPNAFKADFTYATGSVKAPALGTDNAGRVRYLDLGFFERGSWPETSDRFVTGEALEPLAALRRPRSDKRSYGHAFILGGSRSYPGAVLMNVLGALHSGVGLVTAFVPERLAPAYAARAPEAIWVGWPETPAGGLALEGRHLLEERIGRASALAVGSGMSREPEVLALAKEILGGVQVPALVDGDALTDEVIRAAKGPLILTPHAGEYQRIAGGKNLREFCRERGAAVILKGPVTRISEGDNVYHSAFGGPVLARGGSGDVLAGLTIGQLALLEAAKQRGEAPESGWSTRITAAVRAVAWHGLAADALARATGQTSATVTQLIDFLPRVLRE